MQTPDPLILDRIRTFDAFPSLVLRNDNDQCHVAFEGDPLPRAVTYFGRQFAVATGGATSTVRTTRRIAVLVRDLESETIKAMDMCPAVFRHLAHVREHFSLSEWAFEVRRFGRFGSPRTTYSIVPLRPLATSRGDVANPLDIFGLYSTRAVALSTLRPEFLDAIMAQRREALLKQPDREGFMPPVAVPGERELPIDPWDFASDFAEGSSDFVVLANGPVLDEAPRQPRARWHRKRNRSPVEFDE